MIYLPIVGSLVLAFATILEKTVLRKRKVEIKAYHIFAFFSAVLVMLPFLYFFGGIEPGALITKNLLIFFLIVLFSIIANLLTFYAMKWEKVTNLEPAKILEPLFVVLLAIIFSFFTEGLYEKDLRVIIPALIAGSALVFSHIRRHHLEFNKYFLAAIGGSFFFALELILSRIILDFYSPLSFYFVRCTSIVILSLIIFSPKFKKIETKVKREMFLIGATWVIYRIIVYYGYIHLGVIFTTLMMMLGPIFIYLFAWKLLKEKPDWKNITAAIIILLSILYVILL